MTRKTSNGKNKEETKGKKLKLKLKKETLKDLQSKSEDVKGGQKRHIYCTYADGC
jgi:hypothetical protein